VSRKIDCLIRLQELDEAIASLTQIREEIFRSDNLSALDSDLWFDYWFAMDKLNRLWNGRMISNIDYENLSPDQLTALGAGGSRGLYTWEPGKGSH